ncbi:histidinol phosphatase-like PHP family hydrolase [Bradyrhizobium elkanii]|nr:histidinol phosphatase-like PHP family hydrolase [Bradyrhizobium elkanii]
MAGERETSRPTSPDAIGARPLAAAGAFGCTFSINPDAHSIPELDHMHWGVEMARKGGVLADRVLNAMPLAEIMRHLKRKRRLAARAA